MPKSRRRPFTAIRKSQATPGAGDRALAQRVGALELQVYEMAKGMEAFVSEMNDAVDAILDQQAEVNLRIIFIMRFHKFAKQGPSGLVDAAGHQAAPIVQTMYDIYMDSRDKFQAQLQEEIRAERQAAGDTAPVDALTAATHDHGPRDVEDRDPRPPGAPPFAPGPKLVS